METDGWNFDMAQAPRGSFKVMVKVVKGVEYRTPYHEPEHIIAADASGTVVNLSYWQPRPLTKKEKYGGMTIDQRDPNDGRWIMYAAGETPLAWMPWPAHPRPKT